MFGRKKAHAQITRAMAMAEEIVRLVIRQKLGRDLLWFQADISTQFSKAGKGAPDRTTWEYNTGRETNELESYITYPQCYVTIRALVGPVSDHSSWEIAELVAVCRMYDAENPTVVHWTPHYVSVIIKGEFKSTLETLVVFRDGPIDHKHHEKNAEPELQDWVKVLERIQPYGWARQTYVVKEQHSK